MKTVIKIASVITVMALLGFATTNQYERKISELQKEIETLKKVAGYSTKQVLDKDLSSFMNNNQQNPELNAVKVNVKNLRQSLKDYPATDNVYVTITDTYTLGRVVTIVAEFPANLAGVCHSAAGGRRCCPPPTSCDPGLNNFVQFSPREVQGPIPGALPTDLSKVNE